MKTRFMIIDAGCFYLPVSGYACLKRFQFDANWKIFYYQILSSKQMSFNSYSDGQANMFSVVSQ